MDDLIPEHVLIEKMAISKSTARRRRNSGDWPEYILNGSRRSYTEEAIQAFLSDHTVKPEKAFAGSMKKAPSRQNIADHEMLFWLTANVKTP